MRITLGDIGQLYRLKDWASKASTDRGLINAAGDFVPFPDGIALSDDLFDLIRNSGIDRGIFVDSTSMAIQKDGILTHGAEGEDLKAEFESLAKELDDAFCGDVTAAKISERIAFARQVSSLRGEQSGSKLYGLEFHNKEDAAQFIKESGALLCHGVEESKEDVQHFVVAPVDMEVQGFLVPRCALIPLQGDELIFSDVIPVNEFCETLEPCTKDGRILSIGDFLERRKAVATAISEPFAVSSNFRVMEALASYRGEREVQLLGEERPSSYEFGSWLRKLNRCYGDSTIAGVRFPELETSNDQKTTEPANPTKSVI